MKTVYSQTQEPYLNQMKKDYYKPIRIGNVFSNNYVEYESNADKDKMLLTEKYLDKMRPYLRDIINDHETQEEWKIQFKIKINFISSKDSNKTRTMHSKSDNIEIIQGSETDEIIEELLNLFFKNIELVFFDSVHLLYYKLHKICPNGGDHI